ncbi:MAG: hypothetical protein QXX30_04375 [Candidatus Aenigmatarchaeota archaeon]
MSIDRDNINYEVLDYPDEFIPIIYNYPNEFLLFPDGLEILMESLDYELFYAKIKDNNKVAFVYNNYFDDSSIIIDTSIIAYKYLYYTIYLLKIEKCYEVYEDYEEDITKNIIELIRYYPKKVDMLYLLGEDYLDSYERSLKSLLKPYLSSPYHYFLKPISKPL